MSLKLSALLEVTGLLAVTTIATTLVCLGWISESICIWLCTLILATLIGISWSRFDGGRHPCFLFLSSLFVFQAGRLAGYVFGIKDYPMQIEVQTALPIAVEPHFAELTLLIIVLSAICIYFPCRYNYVPITTPEPRSIRWLPSLYATVLLTTPFSVYKNLMYYQYIRTHGGYLAIYTDNAAVLQSAGTLARSFSLVNVTAILVLFVVETRQKRVRMILGLFVLLSVLDLLIGFRGKFFSEIISLWYLVNLKRNRGFRLPYLFGMAAAISFVAVFIGFFREENAIKFVSPLGFLVVQGISMNVTEAAVKYHNIFSHYGWQYIWGGFINGFTPSSAAGLHLWSGDLSTFLNPHASELGFGTASSYLAELYLFGGIPSIIIGSLCLGYLLHLLHKLSFRTFGLIVLALVLPAIIYLPRLELLNPLAVLVKSSIAFAIVMGMVLSCDLLLQVLRFSKLGEERSQ